ncbi:cysteine desulfurase family protein [Lacticaseibacillus daqingensis]|uniref:cysteine desulfurase family protein n=1 Tax=Lacticaseibacillus daqingensis TaxID=2486014 RepID=UPI000F77987C|nr:cysteine desulfurase family protein [Lacticaseibacillus daqingensis]
MHTYLDNAATTPMAQQVIAVMAEQMQQDFGNPSSTHWFGRTAHTVMDQSRQTLAQSIGAKPTELQFTSGATEANNTAILQTAHSRQALGRHIITTAIEHPSVLKPMAQLEQEGFTVTYLPVDETGQISLADFDAALDDETILVSVMMGNNEMGSHLPIAAIGTRLAAHQAWFHTDATQAYGLLPIDVDALGVDLLSVSAHKLNGPKGVGFLYRRADHNFPPLMRGGEQEMKRRAGTENVVSIAGFAEAVRLISDQEKADRQAKYLGFKHQIMAGLRAADVAFEVNGTVQADALNHVFNLWFPGVSTYALQTNLDLAGFAVSGGSACTAGSLEPSHVLTAMYGAASPRIAESIRVSFGSTTTALEITQFTTVLTKIVTRLRKK